MRDIELDDPRITVAVLRELAGIRTVVPSNRDFPIQKMDKLVANPTRVRRSPALPRRLAGNARRRDAARPDCAARPIRVAGVGAAVTAPAQKALRPRSGRKGLLVIVQGLPRAVVAPRRAKNAQSHFFVPAPVSFPAQRSIHPRDR